LRRYSVLLLFPLPPYKIPQRGGGKRDCRDGIQDYPYPVIRQSSQIADKTDNLKDTGDGRTYRPD